MDRRTDRYDDNTPPAYGQWVKKTHQVILHCGTNDLNSNKTAENISKDIVKLAQSIESNKTSVVVSSILPRNDHLNNKAKDVNDNLNKLCKEKQIPYIQHTNIDPLLSYKQRWTTLKLSP